MEEVQNTHGVRSPGPADAPTSFKIAFVVETHGRLLEATELTFYTNLAEHYATRPTPNAPPPYVGNNWPSIAQYFGTETTWSTTVIVVNPSIPAVSAIGMVAMTMLILAVAIVILRRAG